jgi:hypothetical protein
MIEIILPKDFLYLQTANVTERDIVIDATSAPNKPLRCTVSCMSLEKFAELIPSRNKFVDTSLWEASHALQTITNVWIWTLRASQNDEIYADRLYIVLIGTVKWGARESYS